MDEQKLVDAAKELERIIVLHADDDGFRPTALGSRYRAFRSFEAEERFRVYVLLFKKPTVAVRIGKCGTPIFFAACRAPADAYSAKRPEGETLLRAGSY